MAQQEWQAARVDEARRQARACKARHRVAEAPPITAPAAQLGCVYGVGIGLYFKSIVWLRVLLLWLALASVRAWRAGLPLPRARAETRSTKHERQLQQLQQQDPEHQMHAC